MKHPVNKLLNAYLHSDLNNGTFDKVERTIFYTLEKNPDSDRDFWELSISHDLCEGCNGEDIQELGTYIYNTREEAQIDLDVLDYITPYTIEKI